MKLRPSRRHAQQNDNDDVRVWVYHLEAALRLLYDKSVALWLSRWDLGMTAGIDRTAHSWVGRKGWDTE